MRGRPGDALGDMLQLEVAEFVRQHGFDLVRGRAASSSVSKNTMRLARPKPVKYALPCPERFEPSITNSPALRKAAAREQRLDALARRSRRAAA